MIMIAWTVDFTAAGSCRAAKLCCQGRDSGCVIQKASPNAIIESPRDTPCYCDHACLKLNDCCNDFKEACNVLDCIVSEWGEWSSCSNKCGIGVQTRTRVALQPDQNGGKHCPQMEHSRSCQSYDACHRKSHLHHNQEVALVSPAMRPSPSQNSIRKVTPGHCAIFTILWVSKTCSREYAPLTEGSHACVVCREDGNKTRCYNKGNTHDLTGIGRWKLSTTTYENCHGKWIGGTTMHTNCDSVVCQDDLFFTFV